MKKKVLFTLLLVSMLVCVFAITVSAHDVTRKVTLDSGTEVALYDTDGDALTWYMDGENLVSAKTKDVISVNGSGVATYNGITNMSVVVANFQGEEIEALEVKQIPSYYYGANGGAYHSYNDTIEYVYLPDTLTTTVTNQFRCTSKLKIVDVTRNSNWSTMGQYCFYYATGLKEFNYPPKVKTTPGSGNDGSNGSAATFSYCKSLEKLYFYDNSEVETFGSHCFFNCTTLTSVNLPNSVTRLPDYVFSGCSSLVEISIPNSVEIMGKHIFSNCKALEVIRMGNGFKYFDNTDHNSFTYQTGKVKEIYIPKSFYKTAPDTTYQVSYAFVGVSSNCKFFYCGTVDEFATAKANFLTQTSATSNNSSFINATVITYDEYAANQDKYASGRYVVCEYNTCQAFYDGEHEKTGEPTYEFKGEEYLSNYVAISACSVCGITDSETVVCGPLFINKGYAKEENGSLFTYGIVVDKDEIAKYVAHTGKAFNYGMIVAAGDLVNDGALFDESAKAIDGTIIIDVTTTKYTVYQLKMTGIKDSQKDLSVYACAYVIDGTAVSYIGEETTDSAVAISYNQIKALITNNTTGNGEATENTDAA